MKEKDIAYLVKILLTAVVSSIVGMFAFDFVCWLVESRLFSFLLGIPAMFVSAFLRQGLCGIFLKNTAKNNGYERTKN